MTEWREVTWLDGYRGVLDVSEDGQVRRRCYTYEFTGRWGETMTARKPDKVLSQYVESNGYKSVAVQINGKRRKFSTHHLVARAFAPGYEPGLCVNHINGNKLDNNAENLEWVTLARNTQHAWETGLVNLRADNNPMRKLSSGQVRIIRRLRTIGASRGELATLCGVSTSTIELIDKGLRWSSVT